MKVETTINLRNQFDEDTVKNDTTVMFEKEQEELYKVYKGEGRSTSRMLFLFASDDRRKYLCPRTQSQFKTCIYKQDFAWKHSLTDNALHGQVRGAISCPSV